MTSHHERNTLLQSLKMFTVTFNGQAVKKLPAHRQKVERYGTANNLLHVRANDRQLNHQPENDPRNLKNKKE